MLSWQNGNSNTVADVELDVELPDANLTLDAAVEVSPSHPIHSNDHLPPQTSQPQPARSGLTILSTSSPMSRNLPHSSTNTPLPERHLPSSLPRMSPLPELTSPQSPGYISVRTTTLADLQHQLSSLNEELSRSSSVALTHTTANRALLTKCMALLSLLLTLLLSQELGLTLPTIT